MKSIKIPKLKVGDKVIFLSPASTPEKDNVLNCKKTIESWGIEVVFGNHIFDKKEYMAGNDFDRLSDINNAISDASVRAIFSTRGGKGAYRIADGIDFNSLKKDPKFLIGFSEITILHLINYFKTGTPGIHGPMVSWSSEYINEDSINSLKNSLMTNKDIFIKVDKSNSTSELTTYGKANGILIGGNLDMITTSIGWALPSMKDKLLFIEAVNMGYGQVDRQLTLLNNSGALEGIRGVVLGQFTQFENKHSITILDILKDRLSKLNVPILGGINAGHGKYPLSLPIGTSAEMDADKGLLRINSAVL